MDEQRGVLRPVPDPQAEMERLARERQVSAGQVCTAQDRHCDTDCEIGPLHCPGWHELTRKRTHDPEHCDRVWGAVPGGAS